MKEVEDNRKRYKIICPYCGKVQYACKSIMHEWGIEDAGHGGCLDCKGFMKLLYNAESDTMTAEKWEVRKRGEMSDMRK